MPEGLSGMASHVRSGNCRQLALDELLNHGPDPPRPRRASLSPLPTDHIKALSQPVLKSTTESQSAVNYLMVHHKVPTPGCSSPPDGEQSHLPHRSTNGMSTEQTRAKLGLPPNRDRGQRGVAMRFAA
jgi:hypothetical protein